MVPGTGPGTPGPTALSGLVHGGGFVEVADRCFVARYAAWDTTIGAVVGSEGVLVVDTRATLAHGQEISAHVRRIAPATQVRWVVNTHEHFDHVLGNAAFADATVYAQEVAADSMAAAVEHIRGEIGAGRFDGPDDPDVTADVLDGVLTSPLRLPDETFASVRTIDLGDRQVELAFPGRGHTAGDLVLRVPDADVVFAGDLLEESAPPAFGSDSFPLDWPGTLDFVVGLLTEATVVVPGHGLPRDKEFAQTQRADVSAVAELIRALYEQGVPLDHALDAGANGWPFPARMLTQAVARGYAHLREAGVVAGSAAASPPLGASNLPLA